MGVYLTDKHRIIVQGITGKVGKIQSKLALEYGTNIVGGVVPGKGGQSVLGLPVFNTVDEAIKKAGANASIIYVPAKYVADASKQALYSGIRLIVIISEFVPISDSLKIKALAKEKGAIVIGPNCPGILIPGIGKMGIIPTNTSSQGPIGVVSRSGTLAFEITANLTAAGIGQSAIVGIGGDPEPCTSMLEVLAAFEEDPYTKGIVMIGEIGSSAEVRSAQYIKELITKPVFSFIVGVTAPSDKKMGHAGAIIRAFSDTPQSKIRDLKKAGARIVYSTSELAPMILKEGIV